MPHSSNINSNPNLILQTVLNETFIKESNISLIKTIELNSKLAKTPNDYRTELIIFKNNCELKINYIIASSNPKNVLFQNNSHSRCLTEENMQNDILYHRNPSSISTCNSHITNTSSSSSTMTNSQYHHQQLFLECEAERISNENENRKSICECIYIAGVPLKNARMLPESEKYPSSCKHKRCSLFPSYVPDILFSYSKQNNTKFELVNSIAALSFPFGIKCCFNQNEKHIPSIDNFITVTTNGNGKRHYVYMLFFYYKIDYVDFKSKYDFDPIKDQLLQNRIITLIESHSNLKSNSNGNANSDQIEKEIESNLALCEELINNDYIYLPSCLCIVSKLPYESQMKSCLSSLLKMISISSSSKEIEQLIIHLLYEIPQPSSNMELSFFIPYNQNAISINGKYIKDFPIHLSSMTMLFDCFDINLIVKIFTLLLNEQKILFVSNDYNKLTKVSDCFISLLYPLKWSYTYIPVLTTGMIKYLQSFIPFIMGMDETMLSMSKEYLNTDSVIHLVFIREKRKSELVASSAKAKRFIISNNSDYSIFEIPNEIRKEVIDSLKKIQNEKEKLDKSGRKVFIKLLARVIGDYYKYVSFIENFALFNTDSYLADKKGCKLSFYNFIINTGLFRQFIQERKSYPYFDKIASRIKTNKRRVRMIRIDKKKNSSKLLFNSSRDLPKMFFIKDTNRDQKKNSSSNVNNSINSVSSNRPSSKIVNSSNSSKKVITSSIVNSPSNQSSSFESETRNETFINQFNHYIIPPYFIQFIHLEILDLNKMQSFLNQKYRAFDSFSLIQIKFIYNINLSMTIPSDMAITHYILPNQRHLHLSWKRKQLTRSSVSINDEGLIKIQESMKSILSCDENLIDFDLSLLSLKKNSKAFVDILYQDKFKQQTIHILNSKSFEKLSHVIFSALVLSSFDYNQLKLITQSLFYYCKPCSGTKAKWKERHYMFEYFASKTPFEIWINVDFWMNWMSIEANDRDPSLFNSDDSDNINYTIDPLTNEDYFTKLLEIATVMNDLNISLQFQLLCLIEKLGRNYIQGPDSDEHLTLLGKTILQQCNNKRKQLE